jgi:hypothetical protein
LFTAIQYLDYDLYHFGNLCPMTDFDTWPKDVVSTREADGISVIGAVIIYFMRKDVNISSIFIALEMMKCDHLIL